MLGFHVLCENLLGLFSTSVKGVHCELVLKGRVVKLLLDRLLAELSTAVDSMLEDCAVILPLGMQLDKLFAGLLEALFDLRWILFLCSWVPVPVSLRHE